MKTLKITIEGDPMTGKSRVAKLISEMLSGRTGATVSITETSLDKPCTDCASDCVQALRNIAFGPGLEIDIHVVQTNREVTK